MSAAEAHTYVSITCDSNFYRIVAATKATGIENGLLFVGTFNPILGEHEWQMLRNSPSVNWHAVISNGDGQRIKASDSTDTLYIMYFNQPALEHGKTACITTYSAIAAKYPSSMGCFSTAASLANVGSSYTASSFCDGWMEYNRGLVKYDGSLVQCLNSYVTWSEVKFSSGAQFTAYAWTQSDDVYIK